MSDATAPQDAAPAAPHKTSLLELDPRTKARNAAEKRFKAYGIAAICIGVAFLVLLLTSIISNGIGAFQQTSITVEVDLLEERLDPNGNRDPADLRRVSTFGYSPLIEQAIFDKIEEMGIDTPLPSPGAMKPLISAGAPAQVRDTVL
ncbi:MAG: DUF3333 domain-containing protein, partial [Pseudomonadota bacterium]